MPDASFLVPLGLALQAGALGSLSTDTHPIYSAMFGMYLGYPGEELINLPPGLSPADNETGWRMALENLARFVEANAQQ